MIKKVKSVLKRVPFVMPLAHLYWRTRKRIRRWLSSPIPDKRRHKQWILNYIQNHPNDLKLHLGCGPIALPGWLNVDLLEYPSVDWKHTITDLRPLPDNSVSAIYAAHVLEHFPTDEVPAILAEWNRVCKPGSLIRLSVPDLDVITKVYQDNIDWFDPPHNPWLGLIYGGQRDIFDFHKTGFNFRWLRGLLQDAGFTNVVQTEPKEMAPGIQDASFAKEPFGVYLSLNMEAVKKV